MSRKLRTDVVTLAARSFSSLEPGAAFCLSRPAIVSLAARTAWVPGPVFAWAAGPVAGALGWAAASEDPRASPRPKQTARTGERGTMGTPETPEPCSSVLVRDGGRRRGIHPPHDRGVPRRR